MPSIPALGELEVGGSEIHGHPHPHSQFKGYPGLPEILSQTRAARVLTAMFEQMGKLRLREWHPFLQESQLEERVWAGSEGETRDKKDPWFLSFCQDSQVPTSPAGRGAGAWERRAGPSHVSCWHGSGRPHPLAVAALSLATWLKEAGLP